MEATSLRPAVAVSERPATAALRFLLLEDNEVDRARMARQIGHLDMPVDARYAATVAEFLEALEEGEFDLAILDYKLPDGSGLSALRALFGHSRQANARAIMLTGADRVDIAVSAMKAGCTEFLSKDTITLQRLKAAVNAALRNRSISRHEETRLTLDAVRAECMERLLPAASRLLARRREGQDGDGTDKICDLAAEELSRSVRTICGLIAGSGGESPVVPRRPQ